MCNYQSRERNFHLHIALTQQSPNILVDIPITKGLIYRSFLIISKKKTIISLKFYVQILLNKKNKNNKLAGKCLLNLMSFKSLFESIN